MIDYIKQNHLGIIIVLWLVISSFGGGSVPTTIDTAIGGINRDTTTITNPFTFQQDVTIVTSFDGFMASDIVDTVATGTAAATFTNEHSPGICDGGVGAVYFNSTGFSPSLQVSLGILTDIDLLATTTIATTTDTIKELIDDSFLLANGETINLYLADITNTDASSTNYANWEIQFGVNCWTLDI